MNDSRQMYAECTHYAALSKRDMDRLRADISAAKHTARTETDWTLRVRAESNIKSLERELHAAETTARDELAGSAASFDSRYVRAENLGSDGQEYAPCVSYCAKPEASTPKAPRAKGKQQVRNRIAWPESMGARDALVKAAVAEVRRVGVA